MIYKSSHEINYIIMKTKDGINSSETPNITQLKGGKYSPWKILMHLGDEKIAMMLMSLQGRVFLVDHKENIHEKYIKEKLIKFIPALMPQTNPLLHL